MVKLEVIKDFSLKDYKKVKNVKRAKGTGREGFFQVGDTFECDDEMAKYLMGENSINQTVAKVIEVVPETEVLEPVTEIKEEPKAEKNKPNKKKKK